MPYNKFNDLYILETYANNNVIFINDEKKILNENEIKKNFYKFYDWLLNKFNIKNKKDEEIFFKYFID